MYVCPRCNHIAFWEVFLAAHWQREFNGSSMDKFSKLIMLTQICADRLAVTTIDLCY